VVETSLIDHCVRLELLALFADQDIREARAAGDKSAERSAVEQYRGLVRELAGLLKL
jgi:hypothetical protein